MIYYLTLIKGLKNTFSLHPLKLTILTIRRS